MNIVIPTPGVYKNASTNVVDARIPFSIGLDTLDRFSWDLLVSKNLLHSASENWLMPLIRKLGHIFLTWRNIYSAHYTRQQLNNMHLHFMHPSSSRLFQLLQRSYPDNIKPGTRALLDDISKAFHACQVFSPPPTTFKVRFPDDVIFNRRVLIDLMWIDGNPVLHVIDAGTNFSAARFFPAEDAKTIWNTFLYAWVTMYLGYPDKIVTDQGSVFTSEEWEERCNKANIELDNTGTESHSSLGQGETYHSMLRRVYNKVHLTHPELPKELRLSMAVKAINDTAGPNGLIPSLLLFGAMPKMPHVPHENPEVNARFKAMKTARGEYEKIISKSRVDQALKRKVPASANYKFYPRRSVYVYQEKKKGWHGGWTGPHLVTECIGKKVMVDLGERDGPRSFNLSQVKPARLPSIKELLTQSVEDQAHTKRKILTPIRDLLRRGNIRSPTLYYTEVLSPRDPRCGMFDGAKRK